MCSLCLPVNALCALERLPGAGRGSWGQRKTSAPFVFPITMSTLNFGDSEPGEEASFQAEPLGEPEEPPPPYHSVVLQSTPVSECGTGSSNAGARHRR